MVLEVQVDFPNLGILYMEHHHQPLWTGLGLPGIYIHYIHSYVHINTELTQPRKISHPKGKLHLPTIDFQGGYIISISEGHFSFVLGFEPFNRNSIVTKGHWHAKYSIVIGHFFDWNKSNNYSPNGVSIVS